MAYVARTIGYWDQLGYTHCTGCAAPDAALTQEAITAANGAAQGVACDWCGALLPFDPTDLVEVSR